MRIASAVSSIPSLDGTASQATTVPAIGRNANPHLLGRSGTIIRPNTARPRTSGQPSVQPSTPMPKANKSTKSSIRKFFSNRKHPITTTEDRTGGRHIRPRRSLLGLLQMSQDGSDGSRSAESVDMEDWDSNRSMVTLVMDKNPCPQGCSRDERCFHHYEVLHIKTLTGHDCLVLQLIAGKPTILAGTVDGFILEVCTPEQEGKTGTSKMHTSKLSWVVTDRGEIARSFILGSVPSNMWKLCL